MDTSCHCVIHLKKDTFELFECLFSPVSRVYTSCTGSWVYRVISYTRSIHFFTPCVRLVLFRGLQSADRFVEVHSCLWRVAISYSSYFRLFCFCFSAKQQISLIQSGCVELHRFVKKRNVKTWFIFGVFSHSLWVFTHSLWVSNKANYSYSVKRFFYIRVTDAKIHLV